MKTVFLTFRGGVLSGELQVPDGPTQPTIIVPTPGGFSGAGGYAMHNLKFDWLEWNDAFGRDVYIFSGISR